MKVICENWKTCKNEDCNFHRNPHVHGATCDDPCEKDNGIKGSKCIPVQEIKYKTEGSGYCLTECEYIDDIKIGSIGCKDCKHCVERDTFNKIVTCTHPKEDKVELYICDMEGLQCHNRSKSGEVKMNKLLRIEYNEGNDHVSLKIDNHRIEIPLYETAQSGVKADSLSVNDQKKIIKLLVENL
jgi:hypothetical protein